MADTPDFEPLPVRLPPEPLTAARPARKRRPRRRPVLPGLLRRGEAARYCGAGVSTWDRWAAAGLTPAAVRLGGAVLWSRAELSEWFRHGCPPRAAWTAVWTAVVAAGRTGRGK